MCSVVSPCTPTSVLYAFWMANRCWPPTGVAGTRGPQIEVQAHVQELVQHKRAARAHRDTDRLVHAIPQIQTLLNEAAKRGEPLGRTASQLQELLDVHGRTQMTAAVADALNRGVPHPNAVRLALERQRQAQTRGNAHEPIVSDNHLSCKRARAERQE